MVVTYVCKDGRRKKMINRDLDGVYFRVERDGKWQSICFSDLTEEEMKSVLKDRSAEWLEAMCIILGQTIRSIGDMFDIEGA